MGADGASKRDKSEILDLFGNIRALRRKLWVWAAGTLRKSLGGQGWFLEKQRLAADRKSSVDFLGKLGIA